MSSVLSPQISHIPLIFLVVIITMGSIGLLATDIYLPALPEMASYFNCSQPEIQASFTVFLVGMASCQLVYGVLCDRFGRKRILLFGISLFILASILCATAESLSSFMLARILQAIGGGVGSVVTRAIIADRYNRIDAVKVFSTTFPIIGLSAAIGPFIGGYLTYFFNWKATFFFMAIYGFITLLLVIFYLKETKLEKELILHKPSIRKTIQGYIGVLRNLSFLGFAFIVCAGFAAFRSYSVESPFVFGAEGYVAEEMGTFYFALSLAYILGNLLAKKLVTRLHLKRVLKLGFFFFVLGGLFLMLGSFYVDRTPYAVILPMSVVIFGNGFLFPTGSAGAMTSVPNNFSGMASGLLGALQFIIAAFCINWIGELCHGHAFSMAVFIGTIILSGLCSFLFLVLGRGITTKESETPALSED